VNTIEPRNLGCARERRAKLGESSPPSRHLVHVFPSFAIGGAQIRFAQLAEAHGERYRHTVIALDGVIDMRPNVASSVVLDVIKPRLDKRRPLRNFPRIRAMLSSFKPDVLVTYNWGSIDWCLANRWFPLVKHIHIEDGFGPEERDHQLRRRVWYRRVALSGRHTRLILPSHQLERIALQCWRLPKRSVTYIPNGVDCTRFTASARSARVPPRPVVIGTVATLRREKNLVRLIHVFASLASEKPRDSLKLIIVGDGPERAVVRAAAAATGRTDQIVFTGARSDPEVALAEMDVFALSSDTEQMPFSVLEAMSSELPIASVAVGDVAEMVSPENRPYVVPRDDEKAFLKSLRALVNDPELRIRLGLANRSTAIRQFDRKLMVDRYGEQFG
jgi:L-malate glycosyltransferase